MLPSTSSPGWNLPDGQYWDPCDVALAMGFCSLNDQLFTGTEPPSPQALFLIRPEVSPARLHSQLPWGNKSWRHRSSDVTVLCPNGFKHGLLPKLLKRAKNHGPVSTVTSWGSCPPHSLTPSQQQMAVPQEALLRPLVFPSWAGPPGYARQSAVCYV